MGCIKGGAVKLMKSKRGLRSAETGERREDREREKGGAQGGERENSLGKDSTQTRNRGMSARAREREREMCRR